MADEKYDLVLDPGMITDLETKDSQRRLYAHLQEITRKVNNLIQVPFPPSVLNFVVDFSGATAVRVSLKWDDVPDDMLKWVDGARIWKANAADDPETDLNKNEKAEVLISSIRTTGHVDLEVTNGATYIYWIQWINISGVVGAVSGGVKGIVGTTAKVLGGPTRESGGAGGPGTFGVGGSTRGRMRNLK